jgi:hypothetical protein
MSLVVRCARCRDDVLEADQIADDEECVLRDHLLAVHPNTIQPETLDVLLTDRPGPPPGTGRLGRLLALCLLPGH